VKKRCIHEKIIGNIVANVFSPPTLCLYRELRIIAAGFGHVLAGAAIFLAGRKGIYNLGKGLAVHTL